MEKKMNKAVFIFAVIVTIALVAIMYFANKRIQELKEIENLYKVAQDSLVVIVNKYNQEVAKTEVLQSENTTLFTQLKIKDKDIIRLQKVITDYEKENKKINTALVISNQTNIQLRDSLKALIIGYSSDEGTDMEFPIYQRQFEDPSKDKWYKGEVIVGLDTLAVSILSKNAYDITIGDEKVNLFKKKLYANITNLNPNTETKVMKVYQKETVKKDDIKKIGIFTVVGLIIGLLIN